MRSTTMDRLAGRAFMAALATLSISLFAASCGPGAEADAGGTERANAAATEFRADDDAGRAVVLKSPARRIVSLLPATTETLVAMGAGDRLVARTDYDEEPAVANLPSVGGGLTPSVELIASLRPDLVIAWEEAGTARVRPRLEALGVHVFAVATRDTTQIFENIRRFGALLDLEHAADSLSQAIRGDLEEVRRSVAGRPRPTVLYLVSLDPPMVAGPDLFIGQVIDLAGGANAFADVFGGSPQVSLEEIVSRHPQVVLLPTSADSAAAMARLRGAPGWRELIDSGRSRVELLPPDILHRPGPSITQAARALRDAIHPELRTDP